MTKQEEIKKGIREILDSPGYGYSWETAADTKSRVNRINTDRILFFLLSKGGVLKVEEGLPDTFISGYGEYGAVILDDGTYLEVVPVESLVEEKL